jgi:hypothetical protein
MMREYKAVHEDAGVMAYRLGYDSITVRFQNGGVYLYNYASTGKKDVENMKKLAEKGDGLTTYISQKIKSRYAARLA